MNNRYYNVTKVGARYYPQYRNNGGWVTDWTFGYRSASSVFTWLQEAKFNDNYRQARSHITMPVEVYDTGWLSPTGELFACNEYEHTSKAYTMGYSGPDLLNKGYVHVGVEGNVHSDKRPTQAQIDWLWDKFMELKDGRLFRYIKNYLEEMGVQTSPSEEEYA